MSKDVPKPIVTEQEVRLWLSNHGVPLELYTADVFSSFKFHRLQSLYYEDYLKKKMCELDVVCYESLNSEPESPVFQFFIECKMSPHNATVMFCDPTENKRFNCTRMVFNNTSPQTEKERQNIRHIRTAIEDVRCSFFDGMGPQCYNLLTAKEKRKDKEDDTAYSAAEDVCNAAAYSVATMPTESPFPFAGSIILPLIVIDGPMFTCNRKSGSDELELSQVTAATLLWKRRVLNQPVFTIQVVTRNGLEEYCRNVRVAIDVLKKIYRSLNEPRSRIDHQ